MESSWLSDLHEVHSSALEVDWESHLAALNERYGLTGDHQLSTADVGLPPAWFNGDVESIQPTQWVLVVSLNPAKPPPNFYRGELTPSTAWDFWRHHNTNWWYTRFFRPLVRLAASALGEPVPPYGQPERDFATKRMIFIELCPYASKKFSLDSKTIAQMDQGDIGFKLAKRVAHILLDEAHPSLVLVNGEEAVKDFNRREGERLHWCRTNYSSSSQMTKSGDPKQLWHYEGWYQTSQGVIPIAGFKFLRKPANHNSYIEIDQLGTYLQSRLKMQHLDSE